MIKNRVHVMVLGHSEGDIGEVADAIRAGLLGMIGGPAGQSLTIRLDGELMEPCLSG